MFSLRRLLHEGESAGCRDIQESLHPVVPAAGKYNAHYAGAIRDRRRGEERIHRRSGAMFLGPAIERDAVVFKLNMAVGRCDVEDSALKSHVVRLDDRSFAFTQAVARFA